MIPYIYFWTSMGTVYAALIVTEISQ